MTKKVKIQESVLNKMIRDIENSGFKIEQLEENVKVLIEMIEKNKKIAICREHLEIGSFEKGCPNHEYSPVNLKKNGYELVHVSLISGRETWAKRDEQKVMV